MQSNNEGMANSNDKTATHIIASELYINKLDEKVNASDEAVPFFSMFRFANKIDYILMTLGTIGALVMGLSCLFKFFCGRIL